MPDYLKIRAAVRHAIVEAIMVKRPYSPLPYGA